MTDGASHQFGAVVVEAGAVPVAPVGAGVEVMGDDLQLADVETLLAELVADLAGTRGVHTTEHLPVLCCESGPVVENLVE